ncbi:hypothetical protein ABH968_000161 [Lysinibacillus sp. RC79]
MRKRSIVMKKWIGATIDNHLSGIMVKIIG